MASISWNQVLTNINILNTAIRTPYMSQEAARNLLLTHLDPEGKTLFYFFILANCNEDQKTSLEPDKLWDSVYPHVREYYKQETGEIHSETKRFLPWSPEEAVNRHAKAILKFARQDEEGNCVAGWRQCASEEVIREILELTKAAHDWLTKGGNSPARQIVLELIDGIVRDMGWMTLELTLGQNNVYENEDAARLFRYWGLVVKGGETVTEKDEDLLVEVEETWRRMTEDEKEHWIISAGRIKYALGGQQRRDVVDHLHLNIDEHGHRERAKRALGQERT